MRKQATRIVDRDELRVIQAYRRGDIQGNDWLAMAGAAAVILSLSIASYSAPLGILTLFAGLFFFVRRK